jgi:hypothetical protein
MNRNGSNHRRKGFIENILRLIPIAICRGIAHHNPELEAFF